MFDQKTCEYLNYYVYALIDPQSNMPFYIGKGKENRVFNHVTCSLDIETKNDKYEKIREIREMGLQVKHIIIRHDLREKEAFEIESALIDILEYLNIECTNVQEGHYSQLRGLMTSDEIIRKYNAELLEELTDPAIIININKKYRSTRHVDTKEGIYEATKEAWVINKRKLDTIKYALSEYRGLIVEVYEIKEWYPVKVAENKIRYGFNGIVAGPTIRNKYINKSIKDSKKQGAANPIRYKL